MRGSRPAPRRRCGTPRRIPGKDDAARDIARRNFLALVFCLMVGTAALPHILMRYYTTPSVRQARESVFWSLFFIFLLYFTAPALAVLAKYDVYHDPRRQLRSRKLPQWVAAWQSVDPTLLSITDVNRDGIVQLAEIAIGGDIIVLATPEIAGLPYVVSGLVAAGGLAAALSTADGLLLTIANALSHDFYYKMIDPNASTARRVTISKMLLLVVALIAAYVASQKPADILFLVSAAFSLAAAAFFPALVLGIFWKRANKWGATLGMLAGPRHHVLLHGDDAALAAQRVRRDEPDRRQHVVGHSADLGRLVGRAARLRGDHHREPAHAGAGPGDAGAGRARPLPEPQGRHRAFARHLTAQALEEREKPAATRAFSLESRYEAVWNAGRAPSFAARRARLENCSRHPRSGWRRSR